MKTVVAELVLQKSLVVNHRRIVIEIGHLVCYSVLLHPFIESFNLFGWPLLCAYNLFAFLVLLVIANGKQRRENDANAVGARQFRHRSEIVLDGFKRHWPGV